MEKDIIVQVTRLSHRYASDWALRDVNFELPNRGVYGLLGSNGAGKSTLMNILCGVIKQTEGQVLIHGIDVLKSPILAKECIGFLPQKPPLYGELTVEEYLHHAADIRNVADKKIKEAIDEVLELCAISHFRKRLIKNLSGGYQQRVGIAQAIIHKPEIVVLDEPTNGLDPGQILDVRRLIKKIAEERIVLLSTHILREVHAICEQILMIERGRVVFSGTINDFDHYLAPTTIYLSFVCPPSFGELERLEGVNRLEQLGEGKFRVFFSDAKEVMEHVVECSAKYRWRLSEMRMERGSLDDVFAELSHKSQS